MKDFNINLKLSAYPSPFGVKPDHFFRKRISLLKLSQRLASSLSSSWSCPNMTDGEYMSFSTPWGISKTKPKSKMELTEFSSALRKYQNEFIPAIFCGTIIEAEVVAYVATPRKRHTWKAPTMLSSPLIKHRLVT